MTVALGQRGCNDCNGCGGSFCVIEKQTGSDPIFVAGGAAANIGRADLNYRKASLNQTGNGNDQIGSSGFQSCFQNVQKNVYCAGAGFHEGPKVGVLMKDSVPPQNYAQGLKGGKGKDSGGGLMIGGFGGGGTEYYKNGYYYWGAGGGFTGGSTKVQGNDCVGGGGGSFSIDKNAKFDHVIVGYGQCKIEYAN